MKVIEVAGVGGPDVLKVVERPRPRAGMGQIVMAIEAIGVNFVDLQHRRGTPYPTLEMPFVPGVEAVGQVCEIGPGVTRLAIGDRVAFAGPMPGAYAEFVAIDADLVVAVPGPLTAQAAASILMQGMTAHYLTHDAHPIGANEWILVHAASSGVGRLVASYAKALGARVIGGTRDASKLNRLRMDGVDEAVVISQSDLARQVRVITGDGCAAIFDSVGGRYLEQNLFCLRARGDLVIYGMADGLMPPFDLARLSGHYDAGLSGSTRVSWTSLGDFVSTPLALQTRARAVFGDAISGLLPLPTVVTFPLVDAAGAHERLSAHAGEKIVLVT